LSKLFIPLQNETKSRVDNIISIDV